MDEITYKSGKTTLFVWWWVRGDRPRGM